MKLRGVGLEINDPHSDLLCEDGLLFFFLAFLSFPVFTAHGLVTGRTAAVSLTHGWLALVGC